MALGWIEEPPLGGVTTPVPRPSLTASGVAKERFQKGYVAWFEANYGLRGTAVRLDSSLDYYVFQEAPAESRVRVGSEGVLYVDDDVGCYNHPALVADPGFEAIAARLARVQGLLRARGKSLVPLLTPSKTSLLPSQVPSAWRRDLGEPRPIEQAYRALARALDAAGVLYVDARALLGAEQAAQHVAMFTRRGRHWNALAACLVMADAMRVARVLMPGRVLAEPDCSWTEATGLTIDSPEVDLLKLLNVWHPGPLPDTAPSMSTRPVTSVDDAPAALFVGTSFSFAVVAESERNRLFHDILVYYYNQTVLDRLGSPGRPVDVKSASWREQTLSREVVIFEIPEWYFPGVNIEFLVQLEGALGE
jgi:hypothetical protein